MNVLYLKASIASLLLCLISCAVKVSPGGGKTDNEAPKVLLSEPEMNARNFKSKTIDIHFDEFVQLKDIGNQLIVSPLMDPEPEITIRGKAIHIKIESELLPNTTYSFSFGNSIADIHENNVIENFRYVFSTGNELDTLLLNGKVIQSKNLAPEKSIFVMLYQNNYDSVPMKEKPIYIARTRENGTFTLGNLRAGSYKIFGLKDLNSDYLYNMPNESIAFSDTLVSPDTVPPEISLRLFTEEIKEQKLIKSLSEHVGKVTLIFRKAAENISIRSQNNTAVPVFDFIESSPGKDTITYWFKNPGADSLFWFVKTDNTNDTLEFAMKKGTETQGMKKQNPFKLTFVANSNEVSKGKSPELFFSHPIASIDTGKLKWSEDSTRIYNYQITNKDSAHRKLGVDISVKEKKSYSIMALPGAFKDIYGETNDTMALSFKVKENSEFAIFSLDVDFEEIKGNMIIQLLDEGDKIKAENILKKSQKITYSKIEPGKYKIKAIFDTNSNEKWDTGDYLTKKQPEKVLFYPDVLELKVNWEVAQKWQINLK